MDQALGRRSSTRHRRAAGMSRGALSEPLGGKPIGHQGVTTATIAIDRLEMVGRRGLWCRAGDDGALDETQLVNVTSCSSVAGCITVLTSSWID